MTNDVVIRATGLGKKYVIGHQAQGRKNPTLREAVTGRIRGIGRTLGDLAKGRALTAGDELEDFWALRDVSFDIKRGDVVGVIGRNGAGKSTLLKVLSRITEPTEGKVEIVGRVASLLEVGTGFHSELTGRENIYLNGAILGMTREEIRRKFDEIVEFAEVEKFLDTPVKFYSSGMYVRLAFAVAAHLEPEILIVDEVLAVGDAAFQQKCLGKMDEVASRGRTVLFVSHNVAAISRLCKSCIMLEAGQVIAQLETEAALDLYASRTATTSRRRERKKSARDAEIKNIVVESASDEPSVLRCDKDTIISIGLNLETKLTDIVLSVAIMHHSCGVIFTTSTIDGSIVFDPREKSLDIEITVPRNTLLPTSYGVRAVVWSRRDGTLDELEVDGLQVQWAANAFTKEYERSGIITVGCEWAVRTAEPSVVVEVGSQ